MYLARPGPLKQEARRWPVKKFAAAPIPYGHTYPVDRSSAPHSPVPRQWHPPQSLLPTRRRSPNPNPLRFRFARRRWTSAVAVLHSSPVPTRPPPCSPVVSRRLGPPPHRVTASPLAGKSPAHPSSSPSGLLRCFPELLCVGSLASRAQSTPQIRSPELFFGKAPVSPHSPDPLCVGSLASRARSTPRLRDYGAPCSGFPNPTFLPNPKSLILPALVLHCSSILILWCSSSSSSAGDQ
jgi:hypothetical protein